MALYPEECSFKSKQIAEKLTQSYIFRFTLLILLLAFEFDTNNNDAYEYTVAWFQFFAFVGYAALNAYHRGGISCWRCNDIVILY